MVILIDIVILTTIFLVLLLVPNHKKYCTTYTAGIGKKSSK